MKRMIVENKDKKCRQITDIKITRHTNFLMYIIKYKGNSQQNSININNSKKIFSQNILGRRIQRMDMHKI